MRQSSKLLALMQHCNSQVTNQNEYMISSAIIRRVVHNEDLSIEQIAEEASISQASISRFIRKAGFDSWQDFRECCSGACKEIGQRRFLSDSANKNPRSLAEIKENIYRAMTENISATNNGFDSEGMENIIAVLESAKEVIFLGDEHALSIFYTLQLDLMFSGITSYLYKNTDIQESLADRVKPGTVVVFLNVENNFVSDSRADVIRQMKDGGAKIIIFSQQDVDGLLVYDYLYRYGVSGSVNNGYYSLFFISQILSESLINRSFSKNESDFHK